jgi:hypothetical protein
VEAGTLSPMRSGSGLILLGVLGLMSTSGAVARGATATATAFSVALSLIFIAWGATARYTSQRA